MSEPLNSASRGSNVARSFAMLRAQVRPRRFTVTELAASGRCGSSFKYA